MTRRQSGITLLELVIALVIVGLISAVSTLAIASLRPAVTTDALARLARARRAALDSGRAVSIRAVEDSEATLVRFFPDGRALGPGVDPLTGETTDAVPTPR